MRSLIHHKLLPIPCLDSLQRGFLILHAKIPKHILNRQKNVGYSAIRYRTFLHHVTSAPDILLRNEQNQLVQYKFDCRKRLYVSQKITLQQFLNNALIDHSLGCYFPAALLHTTLNDTNHWQYPFLLVPSQGHPCNCILIVILFTFPQNINQRRMNSPNNKSTPLLINKNILSRQSIFKRLDHQNQYSAQEKAKESQLYQQLDRKIEVEREEHEMFMRAIDQKIVRLGAMIQRERADVHEKKIDLWELKNEVMQLHQMIEQDQEQHQEEYQEEEEDSRGQEEEGSNNSSQLEQQQQARDLSSLLQKWGIKKQSSASLIQNRY